MEDISKMANKQDLIAEVAAKTGLTKKDSEKAVNAFGEVVTEFLAKGEKVQLIGFGTFETRERAAREGRNPQTGEAIKIAATVVPA
ncbi:HU family DNA-binding protein, partial [Mycobacterium kansasii]